MKLFRDLSLLPESCRGGAVSIGNFDGVHLGHARIVERLLATARALGGPALVFTFDPHPVRLLRPTEAPPPLTWTDRKAQLLSELGVDAILAYPTDEELLRLSAAEFFQSIVVEQLGARAMVEGPNFFFGRNREGNVEVLARLCTAAGRSLEVVEPVMVEGEYVSSSRVRSLLAAGDVDLACKLLTAPYRLRGIVVHGAGRGQKIGFPTANLQGIDTLLPGPGVYAGRGWLNGRCFPAAINVGPNPTFSESHVKLEVHLVGLAEPLYGRLIEVDFLSRLRDITAFASVAQLTEQLRLDVARAMSIAGPQRP